MGAASLRFEADCGVEIGEGLDRLFFVAPRDAAVLVSCGILGIDPDGLRVVRNGLFVLPHVAPHGAALDVGPGVMSIDSDGLVTRQIAKQVKDSRLDGYEAPALLMQKETTGVLLDPVARLLDLAHPWILGQQQGKQQAA